MSQVYKALEKAEKRKSNKEEEDSFLQIFEDKKVPPGGESVSKSFEERIKKVEFPSGNGNSPLIPPLHSYSAEQFRKVKTHILNQSPPLRSVLITSTVPAEGKSMVAFNLALSLAQEKHIKTILVDADLRKSSIYPQLASPGLSEYLDGRTSWEEILVRFEAQNLFLIPAGAPSPKAPELIGSPRMKELLKNLLNWGEETCILIDAPPILATSEPAIFSKLVDGIILVVMSDRAPKKSVRKALDTMGREKIIGLVFNQINLKPPKQYSEHYYRDSRK